MLNATCCVWWGLETTTKRTKQCGSDSDALLSFDAFHIVKFLANISIKPTESNASLLLLMHQSVISNSSDSPDSEPTPARSDSRQSDVDMPHVVFGGALKRLQREQSSHHVIL